VVANGCVHGADVEPTVAIWGDSYAAILAAPIGDVLAKKGMAVKELTMSACAPIVGLYRENLNHGENCVEWNNLAFNYLIQSKNIKTVIIQSNWTQNLNEPWLMRPIIKNGRDELAGSDYSSFMQQSLTRQFQSLVNAGKKVVLVMPIPQAGENIPRSYARLVLNSSQPDADAYRSYEQFERDALNTMQIFDRIQNGQGFSKLNVVEYLCDKNINRCFTVKNGVPLYFDGSHLSLPGVYRIINPIVGSFAQ
jgi:hypothetical protein